MSDDVLDQPEVVALYGVDPSEFVAARNAVVAQLKAAGDKVGAKVVAALKKPTKTAWAINQVARGNPERIDELREAGADLRQRQDDALSGGDAAALREATARRRDVVRGLAAEVAALAGDAHREEAAATFETASVDDEVGALVAAGRLTGAVARTADLGFLGLLGGVDDGGDGAARQRSPASGRRSKQAAVAEPVRIDVRRIQKLERALAAAEDARTDAEHTVERATAEQEDAAALLVAAQERVAAAERALDAATDARHAAERAVTAAQAELDAARGN